MLGGVDGWIVAVVALALLVGALVQGVVGLGLGLISAPVVTMLAPELMPGMLLLLAMLMPVVTLASEREDIDWRGLAWSLPARIPGTVVGVWLVATVNDQVLSAVVAASVLVAVLVTVRSVEVWPTRRGLTVAGFVSGVMGTATSIGGPPLVILYQHRPPRQVRTTMAVYFSLGAAISLIGLLVVGELDRDEVALSVLMLPVLVVGGLVAKVLRPRLDGERFRSAALLVCALAALALLVRALLG